tara:strand:+ start:2291 stop:3577 length:1287 start_codon:yes stop_codon:yes gene_type:complete
MIHHHLFGNGITFSHRRGRIRPDPHMQEIMTDYWMPCCKALVDSIMAIGIAIIRVVQMDDGLRVPVVLEPECCQIKMRYVFGVREYTIMDDQQQIVPDTFVLDDFGFSPTMRGSLTSTVCNLIPQIQYVNTLMGTSLTMERKRADPVIMTESVDTKVDNVEGINYDYYADGDMQDTGDKNKFQRNRSNIAQLAQQQNMYDAFFAGESGVPSTGSAVLDNVVTLPIGQRVVNTPQQTGRSDVVAQVKLFEDTVCGVLGVPRSLIMSDTPHKSDSAGTHQTFQKTILSWKTHIQEACGKLYNIIYSEDITKQLVDAMGKKRKRESTIADVYALKKRMQVEIIFPISPFMNHDSLFMHYQRGVLPWDTYVEHACAQACLPHTKMPEPKQQMSDTKDTSPTEKGDKKKKEESIDDTNAVKDTSEKDDNKGKE